MTQYTVILRRPARMVDEDFPDMDRSQHAVDSYWAHVEAEGYIAAIQKARKELARADNKDWLSHIISYDCEMIQPEEYHLIAVLDGHHTPVVWGWQLPGE